MNTKTIRKDVLNYLLKTLDEQNSFFDGAVASSQLNIPVNFVMDVLTELEQSGLIERHGMAQYKNHIRLNLLAYDYWNEINGTNTAQPQDEFSSDEERNIYEILDSIVAEQKKANAGQEVLFNEINELKDYIVLGKKGFRQMATGKVAEMVVSGVIDKTVGNNIYETITAGLNNVVKLIDNL